MREVRPAGRTGAVMMQTIQEAGDWSDAESPDLVLAMSVKRHPAATIDVGCVRFVVPFARAGDFVVIPPNTATTFIVEGDHELRLLSVPYTALLQLGGPDGALPTRGDFGVLHTRVSQAEEVSRLMGRLWGEGLRCSPHGALYADGLLLHFAAELLSMSGRKTPLPPRGRLPPWKLRRLTDYLQDRLADDVSLSELSAMAGLSTANLCRAFKQSTGLPPHQWQLARRIKWARELLESTDLRVTAIAAAIGYGDPGQFATLFRRHNGVTASAYRRDRRV